MLVTSDFYFPSRFLKGNRVLIQYENPRFNLVRPLETDYGRAKKRARVFCVFPTTDHKHLFDDCLVGKVLQAEN